MDDPTVVGESSLGCEDSRGTRQKRANVLFANEIDPTTKTFSSELRKSNSIWRQQQRESAIGIPLRTVTHTTSAGESFNHTRITALSSREQEQIRIESDFVSSSRVFKPRQQKVSVELGTTDSIDMMEAIRLSVQTCSKPLVDWNQNAAKLIGATCKIYWDGEDEWFYARILNYDSHSDRHFVYYYTDSTSEWLSIRDEFIFVAEALVLAKMGGSWPALRFWISPHAYELLKTIEGYRKNCEYVEFFSPTRELVMQKQFAFLPASQFDPLSEEFFPSKPPKSFDICMEHARNEKLEMCSIVDSIVQTIRKNLFTRLVGAEWVGVRVRASTHRIITPEDLQEDYRMVEPLMVRCIGKIVSYNASADQHLVVFDEPLLQPQWVRTRPENIDVLLGPESSGYNEPMRITSAICLHSDREDVSSSSSSSMQTTEVHTMQRSAFCFVCGTAVHASDPNNESSCSAEIYIPYLKCRDCSRCYHENCLPQSSVSTYCLNSECGVFSIRGHSLSWYSLLECEQAERDSSKSKGVIKPQSKATEKKSVFSSSGSSVTAVKEDWLCFDCLKCEGCGVTSSSKALLQWNVKRVSPEESFADRPIPICADCMVRFKEKKDYCPVCYKFYDLEDEPASPQPCVTLGEPSVADKLMQDKGNGEETGDREPAVDDDIFNGFVSFADENVRMPSSANAGSYKPPRCGKRSRRVRRRHKIAAVAIPEGQHSLSSELDAINEECGLSSKKLRSTSPVMEEGTLVVSSHSASPMHLVEPVIEETFIKTGIATEGEMVQCNECVRWVHAKCELIDEAQYHAMSKGSHPVWGSEYLCPHCRVAITKKIVAQLQAADQWTVFAAPVDETVARDYYDVIRHPMDLSTMCTKAERGQYKSMQSLREDFELMCLNAMIYNKEGDEWWTAAREFEARGQEVFRSLGRRTQSTAFGAEIAEILEAHGHKALQKSNEAEAARRSKKMAGTTREGYQPNTFTESADQPTSLSVQPVAFVDAECQECLQVEEAKVVLPDALSDPYAVDPPNEYAVSVAYAIPGDQAFFSCTLDQCLVCGSSGAVESMLFCCDCGEAFHSFCAKFPLATMSAEARLLWRCANCKICNVCGNTAAMNDAITCASCQMTSHFDCLVPAMVEELPSEQWFCSDCVLCNVCQWDEFEGTDDDAGDLMHSSHSWGTSRKLCWECQLASAGIENICGSYANGTLVAMVINGQELEAAAISLDRGNVCYLCEGGIDKEDSSSHGNESWEAAAGCVTCPQCTQRYHTTCAGNTCLPWIAAAAHDFRCPSCLVALADTEMSEWTHLNQMIDHTSPSDRKRDDEMEGKDAMMLLMQVAEIQRNRCYETLAKKDMKRDVLEAILHWAAGRVAQLDRDSNSFPAVNSFVSSDDDTSWLLPRAHRFVIMCRQDKLAAVLRDGSEMPIKILTRLAAMASAYLKVTRHCQNSGDQEGKDGYASIEQMELAPICLALVARKCDVVDESCTTAVEALGNQVIAASQTLLLRRPISSGIPPVESVVSGNDTLEIGPPFDTTMGFRSSLFMPLKDEHVNDLPRRHIKSEMDNPRPLHQHQCGSTSAHDEHSFNAAVGVKQTIVKQLVSCDLQRGDGFYARKARMYYEDGCQGIDSAAHDEMEEEGVLRGSEFVRSLAATVERARAEVLEQHQQENEGAVGRKDATSNSLQDISTLLQEMVNKVVASVANTVASQSCDNEQSASALQSLPVLSVNIDPYHFANGYFKSLLSRRKGKETNATASGVDILAGWSSTSIGITRDQHHKHTQNWAATASSGSPHDKQVAASFLSWMDPRSCSLCHAVPLSVCDDDHGNDGNSRCMGDDAVCGRLLPLPDGSYAHINCLRWSSEAIEIRGRLFFDISNTKYCALCHLEGATVGCMAKSCKRCFHLQCAIASNCCMIENRVATEPADTPHAIYPLMACPEHFSKIDMTKMNRQWVPEDPKRSLIVAGVCNPCQPESHSCRSLSDLMSQGHKVDRALRFGGLTVHAIGAPRIYSEQDADCFHSATRIFPHHYRASRIFWSMRHVWRRTLYVFEICAESDIENFHEGMLLENQGVAAATTSSQSVAESFKHSYDSELPAGLSASHSTSPSSRSTPIFRIVAEDLLLAADDEGITSTLPLPSQPMLTRSIDYAYNVITAAVTALQAADVDRKGFRPFSTSNARTFSRNAAQFFGLGLPLVKQAIEMIPDSHAAMIAAPPVPQYCPCYVLPTQERADRIYRMQMQALSPLRRASVHGSARADGIDLLARAGRPRGTRVTRVLSKAANDNHNVNDETSSLRHDFLGDGHNEGIRKENELNRLKYAELSAAYLRDPFARLQVRKSSIHGGGLYAAGGAVFEKGEMIVEYIGQIVRQAVADRREVKYEEQGLGSCYLFRVDKDSIVDATQHGGIGRFINHSCDPNAYAKIIETTVASSSSSSSSSSSDVASSSSSSSQAMEAEEHPKHIIIFAARDIFGGEEITYDYKFPIEEKKLRCYCGAPRCQGSMN